MLTEVLTTIITSMNQQNIKFSAYNNIYFETLYYIRSFTYEQKSEDIRNHFMLLLTLFENELSNLTIKSGELQEFIEQTYTSTDLSIAMMAEKFHVSIAYMSYLCKKYFNENFSDYLWNLRVHKSKDLKAYRGNLSGGGIRKCLQLSEKIQKRTGHNTFSVQKRC